MWHIASQVTELKKLTLINKDILMALRSNYDKPEQMKELFRRLQSKFILSSYIFRLMILIHNCSLIVLGHSSISMHGCLPKKLCCLIFSN